MKANCDFHTIPLPIPQFPACLARLKCCSSWLLPQSPPPGPYLDTRLDKPLGSLPSPAACDESDTDPYGSDCQIPKGSQLPPHGNLYPAARHEKSPGTGPCNEVEERQLGSGQLSSASLLRVSSTVKCESFRIWYV